MGVHRPFFQEGRAKSYFSLKTLKNIQFSSKSQKTYYFWPVLAGQGGQEPPFPPPDAQEELGKCLFWLLQPGSDMTG